MKLNYRSDIDGLRALAVLGVLLFHAEIPGITGGFVGVDIFFVISGYLISSILILELDKTEKVDFINFWARRTRRLLPSASVVILSTMLASYVILTNVQFYQTVRDAIWASTYVINWTKLISAVQYFDEGGQHGPFLHYWSLAVEEQFYFILALIFFVALKVKKFLRERVTWATSEIVVFLILFFALLSFIANLYYILVAQPISFFGTHTRIWELALGVAVGVIERKNYIPTKVMRKFCAWMGMLLMLGTYFTFTSELHYPGIYAVIPTIGATIFLFAGINATNSSTPKPLQLLSTRTPVAIGRLSYSLYLWHWPIFVLWKAQANSWSSLDIVMALVLTWMLSWFFYTTVESPIRFSKVLGQQPRASLVGALILTIAFVFCAQQLSSLTANKNLIVLSGGKVFALEEVKRKLPSIYQTTPRCHVSQDSTGHPECVFGSTDGSKSILLFGDSHAAQWFPAFEGLALRNDFRLYSRTKSACASIDIKQWHQKWKREYTECSKWRDTVLNEIKSLKPDYVVLANSSTHTPLGLDNRSLEGDARLEALFDAESNTIERLRENGATIILMQETPRHKIDPLDCLVENPSNDNICHTLISEAFRKTPPQSKAVSSAQNNANLIDMTKYFCWNANCYVTDGEFVFNRDKHHISQEYSLHLSDSLEKEFFSVIDN